jgi:hypothetical protein
VTRARARDTRRRRRAALLGTFALVALLSTLGWLGLGGGSRASAQPAAGEPIPQTDDSVPASHVTMIGSSPAEAPNETWGVGQGEEGAAVLVHYVAGSGWSLGPALLEASGRPLSSFKLDQPGTAAPSPLAGQITAGGSGVLVGSVPSAEGAGKTRPAVLVRDPGGAFQETAPVPSEGEAALLKAGESLFATNRVPLTAALDEASGHAGALIVPVGGGEEEDVLHWDGTSWTSEPIEVAEAGEFHVVGIAASSPANAWLLAELPSGSFGLFRRHLSTSEGPKWLAVAPLPGAKSGEPLTAPVAEGKTEPFRVQNSPNVLVQSLTVTADGVWIDGERSDAHASTTMFLEPQGESGVAAVTSWCVPPAGAPACDEALPDALPAGTKRSFAWVDGSAPFGDRVITGLADGVSLRLDGSSFTRVLALGGSQAPNDVGGTYGAAFAGPREGWLGQAGLPVHLTLEPSPSRLAPWPVSFRHALLSIAPEPGAPVGALGSEALAVGDRGEVARYSPGKGWLPESLLTAGGRRAKPVLRSVAWPTSSRAYAVGDEGQMWLWRGETGLWEQDPATPFNFRGNLVGVAFDPSNPDRGYAVGQGGVLLGYGKTWAQEALPPQVAGASFTSIAFAGSEAIVAYRELPDPSRNSYTGGLLVNDGSGWRIDESAAAAVGRNVPEIVAGLPGGEAAFAASGPEPSDVLERSGPDAAWQPTPQPLPGGREPGSLALFKEGAALRVVASGSALNTFSVESASPAPPESPPVLINPYPLEESPESGVLRQTASGWSDEEHELNNAREPPGHYRFFDTPFQPDPISAVLVDPSGSQGWAVGGYVDVEHEQLDTADIDRYPADGVSPAGVGSAPVQSVSGSATFAIGGGAQCSAPCADGANAGIGPDLWLSSALARAGQISGVRAFLYTGPRVTTGETTGPATTPIPYAREYGRYAQLLAGSLPAYAAASPTDLAAGEGESLFAQSFLGAPSPFGTGVAGVGMTPAGGAREECGTGPGCQSYYAMDSSGTAGTVRVIVLDESTDVGEQQREWLASELRGAKARNEPAIVVGNANLNTQIAAGDPAAGEVARLLVAPCAAAGSNCTDEGAGASAYFFDSPEENVTQPLRVGATSIPTFGSGTLGYVNFEKEGFGDFLGASGFLLGQVNFATYRPTSVSNRAEVTARLIPSIGELGLEAQDGTLLRRSQAALFQALARRPRAGNRSPNGIFAPETDPYIPIPSNCVGTACANGLFPEYTFSSSRPDIGDFVEPNLASPDPHAVLLGANEKPIHDAESGLFCAYNAGTTIVTISTGGLSFSLPVTVQAGSVRQPCGTAPLSNLTGPETAAPVAPPAPAPAPAPAGPAPAASPTPLPVPPPPVVAQAPAAPSSPSPGAKPFFLPVALSSPVLGFVPPPLPTPARPTPPSGTSAVTSPVEAAEKEEESEEATEQVNNQAVAYRSSEHEPAPVYLLGIVLLAAFAGASIRRGPRRGRRGAQIAPAKVSSLQTQEQRRTGRRSRF